eukprot:13240527-Alexandrium_andersonii.AAC.1
MARRNWVPASFSRSGATVPIADDGTEPTLALASMRHIVLYLAASGAKRSSKDAHQATTSSSVVDPVGEG